jgi:hypothetical protein
MIMRKRNHDRYQENRIYLKAIKNYMKDIKVISTEKLSSIKEIPVSNLMIGIMIVQILIEVIRLLRRLT